MVQYQSIVLIGHVLVAVLIVVVVLLQRGKGAEAGTGFGAGASATVFGARGSANFFTRVTAVLAVLFFATSLTLAYFAQQTGTPTGSTLEGSVLEGSQTGESTQPTVAPAEPSESGDADELPPIPVEPPADAPAGGEPGDD
jgi:preprotein translocase subunit SecG